MTALDTSVVVRLVTRDHPAQTAAAARVMRSASLWLPKTVVLETAWVLAHAYAIDRPTIHATLRRLLGLRHLAVEDRAAVLRALRWYRLGLDIADALHLASSRAASRLVTFDRTFRTRATRCRAQPPVERPR